MRYSSRITFYAIVAVGIFLLVGASVNRADAAPLTYNANTIVQTTSPASTLTILSGSVADQVQVNATSVMVTMSATTGGTFSIQTASTSLTSSPAGAGLGCNGGLQTASYNTSTASTVYTVTPSGSACSDPLVATVGAAGSASTGGGGGGGSGFIQSYTPAPAPKAVASTAPVTPAVKAPAPVVQQSLGDQLVAQQSALVQTLSVKIRGSKDLVAGSQGDDVNNLQLFLISKATGPAAKALGAVGANGNFGPLTKKALAEYQKSVGITPTGTLGPKTKTYISSHTAPTTPTSATTPPTTQTPPPAAASPVAQVKFQKDLSVGASGGDVNNLQLFLISKATGPAAKALGAVGANGNFGPLTKKALAEYQKSVGVTASGYFGPKTRDYVNSLK